MNYDPGSDTLFVDTCAPYAEQESDEIAPGIVARLNPSTGDVENVEILFFRERVASGQPFTVPVQAALRIAG